MGMSFSIKKDTVHDIEPVITKDNDNDNDNDNDKKDEEIVYKPEEEEKDDVLYRIDKMENQIIILNQAYCHKCNVIVKCNGMCKCGNVEVFGGKDELGRKVKHPKWFSDCNLIEYTGSVLKKTDTSYKKDENDTNLTTTSSSEQTTQTTHIADVSVTNTFENTLGTVNDSALSVSDEVQDKQKINKYKKKYNTRNSK
jgi:hypothetical protein